MSNGIGYYSPFNYVIPSTTSPACTTTTTTKEYDSEGRLIKETTVTTIQELLPRVTC